jgi:hypothetical protein
MGMIAAEVGTLLWTAPEIIRGEEYTKSVGEINF